MFASSKFIFGIACVLSEVFVLQAVGEDWLQSETCEQTPLQIGGSSSSSLLQVQANTKGLEPNNDLLEVGSTKQCSYLLQKNEDGTKECSHLVGTSYTSGRFADLTETGYKDTAKLCCHHEMSLFVRREISRQGFDICDLSDLHGFVHWYDCTNDTKTYVEMKEEIAGVMGSVCPWLGHLPTCPPKDPDHCGIIARCKPPFPFGSLAGDIAPLSQEGYAKVAARCCYDDMAKFVRRVIDVKNFVVCDVGAFQGFLHWFDCKDDEQTYAKLTEGLVIARSGLPPMCPWLGSRGEPCPPRGHNCPVVEVPEPAAHRRRISCR